MAASRPPLFLRVLVGVSLAGAIAPAGFAFWSLRDWAANWAGRPLAERRAAYGQVPWLRAPFPELAAALRAALPADARVLVEPVTEPGASRTTSLSPPRWHVFLAHYVYPVRFYVRAPALACVGFHHEAWLDQHFEVLDLDGSQGGPRESDLDRELAERGITWRLRMPVRGAGPELFGLDRREGGAWVEVPFSGEAP